MSRALIMIHGFRGTHHGLQLIADRLPHTRLYIPDLPGFGDGDSLPQYDLDSYVQWLVEYINKQHFSEPPVLLGHSFGSIIAARYASLYPTSIHRLVLVNPIGAPALEGPRGILSKLAVFYYWLGKKLPARIAERWLANTAIVMVMSMTMAKTKDRNIRAFIHDQHRRYFSRFHSARSVYEAFKTSVGHSVRDDAAVITTPTLLIAGDLDDITPLAEQKKLQTLFKSAQLEVIEGVGHLTHYETPDEVSALIEDFIKPL